MNVIHKLLEGFAKSAMVSFNKVCTSQLAIRCGSISQKLFKDTFLHTQLIDILNDLESVYLDLVSSKLWAGVNAAPQASSFKAALANGDDANAVVLAAVKHMPVDVKKRVLVAVKTLPWEEWVKLYATCHHCGKKDMSVQCALYSLQQSSPARSIPNILAISTICTRSLPSVNCLGKLAIISSLPKTSRILKQRHSCLLFKLRSKHFFANEEVSNDDNDGEDKDLPRSDDCNVNDDDNDLRGFLSMVGSLKD
jgi:hypothetical protein